MKINKFFNKTVIGVCCSVLAFSGLAMSTASAETPILNANEVYAFEDSTLEDLIYLQELGLEEESGFYELVAAIENLPDHFDEENLTEADVQEIARLLATDMGIPVVVENDSLNLKFAFPREVETEKQLQPTTPTIGIPKPTDPTIRPMGFTVSGAFACIGALGSAIPAFKILKINKALKAAGGAINAMKEIHKQYMKYRTVNKFSRKNALRYAIDDLAIKKRLSTSSRDLLHDFFGVSLIAGACGPLFTYDNKSEEQNYLFDKDAFKTLT